MTSLSVRDFLRGGYKNIREPVVITKHGRPIFTVLPIDVTFIFADTKIGTGNTSKTSSR